MKKYILLLTLFFSMLQLFANDERINMIIGTTKSIQTPFIIDSYKIVPAKTDVIKVEASESHLQIMASAIGEVTLLVSGGGMQKSYIVSVRSNLAQTLRKLRNDLDTLTELDISTNEDQIVIRGVITDPEHWAHFMKVLPNYSGKCMNFAIFKPSAKTVLGLKKMLTEAGYSFSSKGKNKVGELTMSMSADAVIISGEMYSQKDVDKIKQLLATQTWLTMGGKTDPSQGKVQAIVNLTVVESVLQVDIVYVGLNETDSKNGGSDSIPVVNTAIQGLYDLVAGGRASGSAIINGNMNSTLKFLAANGVSRTYHAGHVSFANNDPQGGTLHTGGTVYVKVNGVENGSLQNIEYGLKIKVNGGLVSPKRAKLTLDLKNSALLGADGSSYTLSEDSTKQTVFCDLDKTIVIAGSNKIGQDTSKSGLPILRNTPVLKWFVSGDTNSQTETKLLILACPRLVKYNPDVQINIPLDQTTAPTYRDAKRDNKVRQEESKRYRGWLNWLNWFGF